MDYLNYNIRYYNDLAYNNIKNIHNNDPFSCEKVIKLYIDEHPYDYLIYIEYANLLLDIGRIEEAVNVIKNANKSSAIYKKFITFASSKSKIKAETNLILFKIKLLIVEGKYEKAFELCKSKYQLLRRDFKDLHLVITFLRKKLEKEKVEHKNNDYYINQIENYNINRFRERINIGGNFDNIIKNNDKVFLPNFKIKNVLKELDNYIPSNYGIMNSIITNYYIFKYDMNGIVDKKLTDYFKVVSLIHSNHYLDMIPISNGEKYPYVDLNYLSEDEKISKLFKKT